MTAPAIRIEHLVKTYPAGSGQTKRAVNDATFDIPAEFLGPQRRRQDDYAAHDPGTGSAHVRLGPDSWPRCHQGRKRHPNRSDTCPMSQVSRPG